MPCDMCGADKMLVNAEVEDVVMRVCQDCVKYGKVVKVARKPAPTAHFTKGLIRTSQPETIEVIVEDYNERIKLAREKKGLKQEELAKIINERESLIHKMESKHFEPSIKLAKKLEHTLRIKLIQLEEPEKITEEKHANGTVTLGDVIKIRKRN